MTETKPAGYWKDWDNVQKELEIVIEEIGRFPSIEDLKNIRKRSIDRGIQYHGGYSIVREKMNIPETRKPNGYWRDWSNLEREIEEVIKSLGHFPTVDELKKLGLSRINNAISRHHGGYDAVHKKMNMAEVRKPRGYWENFANVEQELKRVIAQLGHFPTHNELSNLGLTGLSDAVNKHHEGLLNVRQKIGYELDKKPKKYWKRWENIEVELKSLIDKVGYLPTIGELREIKRADLVWAMYKYHGGYDAVRKRLEEKGIVKSEKDDLEGLLRGYADN